jgi:hypothetical protein
MSTDAPDFEGPFEEARERLAADLDDDHEITPTPDGETVDWAALWAFYDFDADSVISLTQLEGAIMGWPAVSHGAADAKGLASEAEAAGHLHQITALAETDGEAPARVLRGYELADGGDQ